MTIDKRQLILGKITSSISKCGYHVTVVQGGPDPRFAYTIGLHEKVGFEVVFAGGAAFTFDEVLRVFQEVARLITSGENSESLSLEIDGLGSMSLLEIERSWGHRMLLGALDYYGLKQIKAFQISPDREHWTIDIPNMKEPWSPSAQPIWKWLEAEWGFPVSPKSKAITNLDALRGHPITEVTRWEENEWELFAGAGPDVNESDIRIVPLGTLLGNDATLECCVNLEIGLGLWREDKGLEWHAWGNRKV
jgi:hypothetical protein